MGSETGMVLITESLLHLSIITLYNKMRRKCLQSLWMLGIEDLQRDVNHCNC